MSATTRWWWVRHAPVTGHGGRLYGQTDVDADVGDGGAIAAVARRLPQDAVWVATPLRRTRQTADAMADALGAADPQVHGPRAPLVEPAFAEQNFGEWQGLTYDEIAAAQGTEAHALWFTPARLAPPGGESFVHLATRVAAAIEALGRAHTGRDLVVIGHGGVIRAALALALDLDPATALRFSVDTLSLTRIEYLVTDEGEAHWRVVSVNERAQASDEK